MSSTDHRQQILAALKKLGPTAPRQLVDQVGLAEKKCGYYLRALLATGEVKASGTSMDRIYALPDQKIEGAPTPPQGKKKGKRGAKRAAPKPHAPRAQPTTPLFLPALTEDYRMVIVQQDGVHAVFTPEQTQAIADLLLTHFEV